jgi:hypothetical protein
MCDGVVPRFQPGDQRLGGVLGPQIEDAVTLQIGHKSAVLTIAPQGERVDAQNGRCWSRRQQYSPHESQKRAPAGGNGMVPGKPQSWPTAPVDADVFHEVLVQRAPSGIARDNA